MAFRQQLVQLLDTLGITTASLRLRALVPFPWLTILTYHRLADSRLFGFDTDVADATPAQFDEQIALLVRHFHILDTAELRQCLHTGKTPNNSLLITFDDGYRNNREAVLPILQRHGARATFFIATTYLTERRIFWWDRVAWVLSRTTQSELVMRYPRTVRYELPRQTEQARHEVLRTIKDYPGLDLPRFLDELTAAAGVSWSSAIERQLADQAIMTWDDVRALRDAGMDIQSHTRTHRVLQTVPHGELSDELLGSRLELEEQLGQPVHAVSYPVGRSIGARPDLLRAVREAGYALGFSNVSGSIPLWMPPDPLQLRRQHVDGQFTPAVFRAAVGLPFVSVYG